MAFTLQPTKFERWEAHGGEECPVFSSVGSRTVLSVYWADQSLIQSLKLTLSAGKLYSISIGEDDTGPCLMRIYSAAEHVAA